MAGRKRVHESDSARATAWAKAHLERRKSYMQSYRTSNKKEAVGNHRKHQLARYGMTEDDYEQMRLEQNGCCACCGRPQLLLHVDHDHYTDKVRGLLCTQCNAGIGLLGDTVAALYAALRYLQRAQST